MRCTYTNSWFDRDGLDCEYWESMVHMKMAPDTNDPMCGREIRPGTAWQHNDRGVRAPDGSLYGDSGEGGDGSEEEGVDTSAGYQGDGEGGDDYNNRVMESLRRQREQSAGKGYYNGQSGYYTGNGENLYRDRRR